MTTIVDASVLIASLMANGRTRDVLLNTTEHLVAPVALREETERHMDKIAARARITPDVLRGVMAVLMDQVGIVASDGYAHKRPEAQQLCNAAQAWGDDEYVALALALDAPVWTLDQDFGRIAGVRVVTTRDMDPANTA